MDPERVIGELRCREPIPHRPEHGATELDELDHRYADPAHEPLAGLRVTEFACRSAGAACGW